MEVCYIKNCRNEAQFFCSCRNNFYICEEHLPNHQEVGFHSMQLLYMKLRPETKERVITSLTKTLQSLDESIAFAKHRADSLISQIKHSLDSALKSLNKLKTYYLDIKTKCNNPKGISRNDYQSVCRILNDFGVKELYKITDFSYTVVINPSLHSLKKLIDDLEKNPNNLIEDYAFKARQDYVFIELLDFLSEFNWKKVKVASLVAMKIVREARKKSFIPAIRKNSKEIQILNKDNEILKGIGFLFDEVVEYSGNVTLAPVISSFLKQELTKTVLSTCTNLNSIRAFLPKEMENFSTSTSVVDFVKKVETIYTLTNSELIKVLMQKFDFPLYCSIIKQFFLFGQGEFYYLLFEEMFLYNRTRDLESLFEECIFKSNARHLPEKCWKDIKLKNDEQFFSLEWDSFTIHYKVDYPLNLFISKEVFSDLQQIFSFIWQVRRVDFILKQNSNSRQIMKFPINSDLRSLLHNLQIARFRFIVFIGNSLFFIMEEVIEKAWKRFNSRISAALSLEDFDFAIKEMTFTIKQRVFINEKSLNDSFFAILSLLIDFVDIQREVEIPIISGEDTDMFEYSEAKERLEKVVEGFDDCYRKFKQNVACSSYKSTCGSFFYQSFN